MRYLRLVTAYLLGALIVLIAAVIGTPLLLVGKACEYAESAAVCGQKLVRKAQRACWKPFQKAHEFAKKVHPDGGDNAV